MIYVKSFILDRIKQYTIQLKYIRYQLNNGYIREYKKLLAEERLYTMFIEELKMILQLIEEDL